jgi:hypothetical protein
LNPDFFFHQIPLIEPVITNIDYLLTKSLIIVLHDSSVHNNLIENSIGQSILSIGCYLNNNEYQKPVDFTIPILDRTQYIGNLNGTIQITIKK